MDRVGLGQDSHSFEKRKKKPLILGGVRLSSTGGFEGNSDGDVILHSLANALSSAIGGDSLGTWADKMCEKQGITDSREYIKYIFNKVRTKGYLIKNIAISIEGKKPHLSLIEIRKIKKGIASLLEVKTNQVGITFTSGKNLSSFGRGKGIQVFSLVNLEKKR